MRNARLSLRSTSIFQVLCSICSPFSGHLYEQLTSLGEDGLTMKSEFCDSYVSACAGQIEFEDNFCDIHTLGSDEDNYWSFPYTASEKNPSPIADQ